MTLYDACKEIKDVFSAADMIIPENTFKDRRKALACQNILYLASKGQVVSKEVLDQILRERDIAISQLESIGKDFGEKMDDVKIIVTARWIEKRHGYLECSNCHCDTNRLDKHGYPIGQDIKHNKPKYCPHCGAYMTDKEEDNVKNNI